MQGVQRARPGISRTQDQGWGRGFTERHCVYTKNGWAGRFVWDHFACGAASCSSHNVTLRLSDNITTSVFMPNNASLYSTGNPVAPGIFRPSLSSLPITPNRCLMVTLSVGLQSFHCSHCHQAEPAKGPEGLGDEQVEPQS